MASVSSRLTTFAKFAVAVLFFKIFCAVLVEYRWYLPPDFENSAFLSGRRFTFEGWYRIAFYSHIFSGPVALLLASFLMLTGVRPRFRSFHRVAGRVLVLCTLAFVVPSGLIMAKQAYGGTFGAIGFTLLSIATGLSAIGAAYSAMTKSMRLHRHMATRCFILLVSPLLLRLAGGAAIYLDCESELYYQLNAWFSWILPLGVYEVYASGIRLRWRQIQQCYRFSHFEKSEAIR